MRPDGGMPAPGVRLAGAAAVLLAVCSPGVPDGRIEVIEVLAHDPEAYTQGLVFHEGFLYESTGRYGESDVRRVDPATGEVLEVRPLAEAYFGEGLALVDDRLIQLTWRERVAFAYDPATLEVTDSLELDTDGWGACWDGEHLYTTSGGTILFRRSGDLEILDREQVIMGDEPLSRVNELECVGDHIYANVYQNPTIVKFDKATGRVVARFDASELVPAELQGDQDAVLNGIAWDPEEDVFYITGKLWPVMYRVRLVDP